MFAAGETYFSEGNRVKAKLTDRNISSTDCDLFLFLVKAAQKTLHIVREIGLNKYLDRFESLSS